MLTPPKRQSRAIMADSLFPKDRKKQETQDITLEPAGAREEERSMSVATVKATYSPLCPFDQDETLCQGTQKEGYFLISNLTYIVFFLTVSLPTIPRCKLCTTQLDGLHTLLVIQPPKRYCHHCHVADETAGFTEVSNLAKKAVELRFRTHDPKACTLDLLFCPPPIPRGASSPDPAWSCSPHLPPLPPSRRRETLLWLSFPQAKVRSLVMAMPSPQLPGQL